MTVFQIHVTYLFFLAKLNFFNDSFTTKLNLLDFIGFWPTFGLFHYAKLPNHKRVRWSWLACPSHTKNKICCILNLNTSYWDLFEQTFQCIIPVHSVFFFIIQFYNIFSPIPWSVLPLKGVLWIYISFYSLLSVLIIIYRSLVFSLRCNIAII